MPMPVDSADRNCRQKDLPRNSTHRRDSNMSGPHTCSQAGVLSCSSRASADCNI